MTTLPCENQDEKIAAVVISLPADGSVMYLCAECFVGFALDYVKARAEEAGITFYELLTALLGAETPPGDLVDGEPVDQAPTDTPAPRKAARRANHQPATPLADKGSMPEPGEPGVLPSPHDH